MAFDLKKQGHFHSICFCFSPSEKKKRRLFWFLCSSATPVVAVLPNKYQALCIHESNKCFHFPVVSIAGNGKVGVPGGCSWISVEGEGERKEWKWKKVKDSLNGGNTKKVFRY